MPVLTYDRISPNGAQNGDQWCNSDTGETKVFQGGAWQSGAVESASTLLAGDGTAAAPSIAFTANPSNGFYNSGGTTVYASSGSPVFLFGGNRLVIIAANSLGWSPAADPTAVQDLTLFRDAAGTLAQRNGVNAQTFRLYGTYATAGTDFERLTVKAVAAADYAILPEAGGTGTLRGLTFGTAGGKLAFFGTVAITKPAVTGAKAGNAAITSLLTQLAALGLITDSSS